MKKRWLDALERVFAAEIEGHTLRSKAQIFKELEAGQYVVWVEELLHFKDGLPPMRVAGWGLTDRGRITYCESCPETPAL